MSERISGKKIKKGVKPTSGLWSEIGGVLKLYKINIDFCFLICRKQKSIYNFKREVKRMQKIKVHDKVRFLVSGSVQKGIVKKIHNNNVIISNSKFDAVLSVNDVKRILK